MNLGLLISILMFGTIHARQCYKCLDIDPTAPAEISTVISRVSGINATELSCSGTGATSKTDCQGRCLLLSFGVTPLINQSKTFHVNMSLCIDELNISPFPDIRAALVGCLEVQTVVEAVKGFKIHLNMTGCASQCKLVVGTKKVSLFNKQVYSGPRKVRTVLECAGRCSNSPFCHTAGYQTIDPNNGNCFLSYKTQNNCFNSRTTTSKGEPIIYTMQCITGNCLGIIGTQNIVPSS